MISQSNNYIINLLQDKYVEYQSKWDYDDSTNPNVLISAGPEVFRKTALEWTDFGLFRITESQSELTILSDGLNNQLLNGNTSYAGRTYNMYKIWKEDAWDNFIQLYQKGKESNSFRTDVPVDRFTVEHNGHVWEYTSTMRPGNGVGQTNIHYFDQEKSRLEYDLNNLIDQYYYYIKSMMEISIDGKIPPNNCGCALRDSEGFYFTKGFRGWSQSPEVIIQGSIHGVKSLVYTLDLNEDFVSKWLSTATAKWETLL